MESFVNCRLGGVSVGSFVGLFVDAVGRWISTLGAKLSGDWPYWNIVKWQRDEMWEKEIDFNVSKPVSFTLIGVINCHITHGFISA